MKPLTLNNWNFKERSNSKQWVSSQEASCRLECFIIYPQKLTQNPAFCLIHGSHYDIQQAYLHVPIHSSIAFIYRHVFFKGVLPERITCCIEQQICWKGDLQRSTFLCCKHTSKWISSTSTSDLLSLSMLSQALIISQWLEQAAAGKDSPKCATTAMNLFTLS